MNRSLIADILDQSDLPELLAELTVRWEEEKKNRQAFYEWVQPDIKAEFINGEIVVHSPVRKKHNTVAHLLSRLMSYYVDIHDLGYVGFDKVMSRFHRNDYEPDISFFSKEKELNMDEEMVIFPIPDLAVEVLSKSTKSRDRGIKFNDYEHHGVGEYWIIDPDSRSLEQYILDNGKYRLLFSGGDGEVESRVISGFRIPVEAIFSKSININVLKKMNDGR